MKMLSKVVWFEGMYLAPHHFQAQNRYFEDSIHFATDSVWRDGYGFSSYALDPEALRNGTVSVLQARGLFEDGLPFDMKESDPLPEARNIADLFSPVADHLNVYLAISRQSSNGRNCSLDPDPAPGARYIGTTYELHDQNTGSDEKPVRLAQKNIRLQMESELSEEQTALQIARVVRDSSGRFVYDASFIPPCLRISASDALVGLLRRLVEMLEEKSASVSVDQAGDGKFRAGLSARQVSQFWFLHAVNSSLTPLRHELLCKHGHPEALYSEMLRLGGALCTFGLEVHPRELPAYDHRHLDECFGKLDAHIRRLLEVVVPSQAITIPLKKAAQYFYEGEVRDQRCFGRSRWILGVGAAMGEADLILKAQQLIKICSAQFVRELVKRALPGLSLTHLSVPPSSVSARVDYQYFLISRSGPCWEHLMQTKVVGAYVPGDLPSAELELVVILES
jgi:type VI secretion system protein ImpJ